MDHLILLNGVTANTTGDWKPVLGCRSFSMQVVLTGTPTGGTVVLEGSNDGTNAIPTVLATFTIGTDANFEAKYCVDKPVAFIRAKLASLSGGTAPTVSAKVAAA
jgi:hypothetical protein